jgi:hypothetical protein
VDEAVNNHARELIAAISAAVANDPAVRACRERARSAGFELDLSLDAVVAVRDRARAGAREATAAAGVPSGKRQPPSQRPCDMTAADRRFLRSLRIAAEEASEAADR